MKIIIAHIRLYKCFLIDFILSLSKNHEILINDKNIQKLNLIKNQSKEHQV